MKKSEKNKFKPSRAVEQEFARGLKRIARASAGIVESHVQGSTIVNSPAMKKALEEYAKAITPWARNQALKMIESTKKRISTEKAYKEHTKKIGANLLDVLNTTENGLVTISLVNEQVELIKSIPLEAAERAQKLVLEGLAGGRRADDIAAELMRTTEVTESRAKLIARTETSRANTALNQTRATSVGSVGYIWRTSKDLDVRDSHRKMEGEFVRWDDPPTLDGMTGHAGGFPNCRCYCEPVLPNE